MEGHVQPLSEMLLCHRLNHYAHCFSCEHIHFVATVTLPCPPSIYGRLSLTCYTVLVKISPFQVGLDQTAVQTKTRPDLP